MQRKSDRRNSPTGVRRTGCNLCFAGWGLFVLSMFLPAIKFTTMSSDDGFLTGGDTFLKGWECAWMVLHLLWPGNWSGELGGNLYWGSFAVANLLLLASPLLLRKSRMGQKMSWLIPALLMLATLDVCSLVRGFDGQPGFRAWVASFGLVTAGSLYLLKAQKMQPVPTGTPTALRPRTADELAAERELENYLRTL